MMQGVVLSSGVAMRLLCCVFFVFFLQAEDGIRDLVRSRGLGDVYKRQLPPAASTWRRETIGL